MTKQNISTIKEPSLEEIIRVDQRGFGYLNSEVDKSYLETIGIASCIGVYLRDDKSKLVVLAHIDKNELGYKKQIELLLEYLKDKKLTDGNFNEIIVLRSQQSDKEGVNEIYKTLESMGYKDVKIVDGASSISVIIDKEGNIYWVDPKTIKKEEKSDVEWKLSIYDTIFRKGLKCENTGEVVKSIEKIVDGTSIKKDKKEIDFVYPGIGKEFHIVNFSVGLGTYGLRIPIKYEDFDEKYLEGLNQEEGIKVSLEQCKYGKYVEIAKYGYPVAEDKKVVNKINDLATKLLNKIKRD